MPEDHLSEQLPDNLNLAGLGLDTSRIGPVTPIQLREERALYRISYDERYFVLKWFTQSDERIEMWAYEALPRYRVPTIPIFARTERALLMEDMASSTTMRLASQEDVENAQTRKPAWRWPIGTMHSTQPGVQFWPIAALPCSSTEK